MKPKQELEILEQEFLDYLEKECGRSAKTIENYDRYLKRFLAQSKVTNPKAITESVVHAFQKWLNTKLYKQNQTNTTNTTLKKNTQNYYLIALRGFLKYLHETGVTTLDYKKVKLTQTFEFAPEHISESELERLFSAPDGKDLKSMRDRAILQLLFSTGVRVSELCTLNANINLSKNSILFQGKGGGMREVTLTSEAKEAVETYRNTRIDTAEALFVNNGKRTSEAGETRLSARSVQRIVRFYAIKAGIQRKITPHVLRHTFATNLVHTGVALEKVQGILGHMHLTSTQIYKDTKELPVKADKKVVHKKPHN